jgi:hypothetical protein
VFKIDLFALGKIIVNCILFILTAQLLLTVICLGFMIISNIGEKALVNETINLSPGDQKTYNLPPGMIWVTVMPDAPIDETWKSFGGNGSANSVTGGSSGYGGIFYSQYTIINPGKSNTNISIRITTGSLNPFGYI